MSSSKKIPRGADVPAKRYRADKRNDARKAGALRHWHRLARVKYTTGVIMVIES